MKIRRHIGVELTPVFLSEQLQRFATVFGTPRDRNEHQLAMLAREWFSALSPFGAVVVRGAFSWAIENHKGPALWPMLGVIVEHCRTEQDGWLDALGVRRDGSMVTNERQPSDAYRAWRARDRAENGPPPGGYPLMPEEREAAARLARVQAEPEKPKAQPDSVPVSESLKMLLQRQRTARARDEELRADMAIPTEDLREG